MGQNGACQPAGETPVMTARDARLADRRGGRARVSIPKIDIEGSKPRCSPTAMASSARPGRQLVIELHGERCHWIFSRRHPRSWLRHFHLRRTDGLHPPQSRSRGLSAETRPQRQRAAPEYLFAGAPAHDRCRRRGAVRQHRPGDEVRWRPRCHMPLPAKSGGVTTTCIRWFSVAAGGSRAGTAGPWKPAGCAAHAGAAGSIPTTAHERAMSGSATTSIRAAR